MKTASKNAAPELTCRLVALDPAALVLGKSKGAGANLTMEASDVDVLDQAISFYRDGKLAQSEVLFRTILDRDPSNAIASHQLGLIAFAQGDSISAALLLRQAATSNPKEPEYLNNLGVVLNSLGNCPLAREAFEGAIALNSEFVPSYTNLGAILEKVGDDAGAIKIFRRALEIDPCCIEARDCLDLVCHRVAPPWHFPMMADASRNRAYEAAISRVASGRRVLDIGTGAGLLAMMAARAGATRRSDLRKGACCCLCCARGHRAERTIKQHSITRQTL